jgi:ribonuclease BN (tRNA processing enzyme)
VRGEGTVWLDAGSGTMAALQLVVGLADVQAVVLSHEHPDHWTDIEGFFVACKYALRRSGVPVYAPAGLRERMSVDASDTFAWHDVHDGDRVAIAGMTFTFSRTDHGPETLAMRIDGGGRSLGYSADTGPAWSFDALGRGLDLALCEATFQREQEDTVPGHLSARQAGEMVRRAGVPRLVLTHFWPGLDMDRSALEAAETFGAHVDVARSGARFEV